MIQEVLDEHGAVDVLCNNVGVVLAAGDPLHEVEEDDWDRTLAVSPK